MELDSYNGNEVKTRRQLYESQQSELAVRGSAIVARSEAEGVAAQRRVTHVFAIAEKAVEGMVHLDDKVVRMSMPDTPLRYSLQRIEVTAALAAEAIISNYGR